MTTTHHAQRHRYDAVLVGAGPAGCVAAHSLAVRGARTLLIDYDGGNPRKGEILNSFVQPILRSLRLSGSRSCGLDPIVSGSIVYWGPAKSEHSTIFSAMGPTYLVDRPVFDQALRSVAKSVGSEMVTAVRLPIVNRPRHVWEVNLITRQGHQVSLTAPLLIDASGRRASVVRRFGRRVDGNKLICVYYLASGRDGCDQDNRWLLLADRNGWWFTLKVGPAERVFCRFIDASNNAGADWWSAMLAHPELSAVVKLADYAPKQRSNFDAGMSYMDFSADGLAAAGDAAYALDPLSGQGLASALSQGIVVGSFASEYLNGRPTALDECKAIQRREFNRTLGAMTSAYKHESRWSNSSFWSRRSGLRRDRGPRRNLQITAKGEDGGKFSWPSM